MGLPNSPWKLNQAILDTGAGLKHIRLNALDPSWRTIINRLKPQGLRSAAGTLLRVVGYIRFVTRMGQRITETGFMIVENLAVNVLMGTRFIGDNFETNSPRSR